jgi:hypothetical protein
MKIKRHAYAKQDHISRITNVSNVWRIVIPVETEHPATFVPIKVYSTQTRISVPALLDSSWMVALAETAL